jgi:5-methylthioadenosine/S-adenosylhomocysteine deaminase
MSAVAGDEVSYLIKADYVYTGKVLRQGAVAIEGGRILEVGDRSEMSTRYPRYERVDGKGCLLLPGLINLHTHMAMSLLRGIAEDLPLMDWLEKRIWPVEAKLTARDIYLGAKLSAVEALLSGTTCALSMYFYRDDEMNEAAACLEAGMRAFISHGFFDWSEEEGFRRTRDLFANWHGREGRIFGCVGPHAPYSVSPGLLRRSAQLHGEIKEKYSERGPVKITIHLAEDPNEAEAVRSKYHVELKEGFAAYLKEVGLLGEDLIAAHCIYLTERDAELFSRAGASIACNPIANLKLAMGIAPLQMFLGKGVNVGLGTDGPASNNTLDMLETVKIASLLQKALTRDPTALDAYTALRLATENGARALGLDGELGRIQKGYLADLVLVNLRRHNTLPVYDPVYSLVYSAKPSNITHVWVQGRLVVEGGRHTLLSTEGLLEEVEKAKLNLLERVGANDEKGSR